MNLEDFKDVYKDKTPVEKLRLLVNAVEAVERCRHGGGDEDYLAREREGQKERANWLYSEIVKALKAQEPRVMTLEEVLEGVGHGWEENWLEAGEDWPEQKTLEPCAWCHGMVAEVDSSFSDAQCIKKHYNRR